jgi:hypothetical protein
MYVPSLGLPLAMPNYRQESVGHPCTLRPRLGLLLFACTILVHLWIKSKGLGKIFLIFFQNVHNSFNLRLLVGGKSFE